MKRTNKKDARTSSPAPDDQELLQTVRAHVRRISIRTGLPELRITLVDHLSSGKDSVNARVRTSNGEPGIDVTRRAARELCPDALEALLFHEFGHASDTTSKATFKVVRARLLAAYLAGSILILAVVTSWPFIVIVKQAPFWFHPLQFAGVVVAGAAGLIWQALKRSEERRADTFAITHLGRIDGAESLFAAWAVDQPEKIPSTRFWQAIKLLGRGHPYDHTRLTSMRAVLAASGSSSSTP